MKSISKDCRCPKCGCITDKYHRIYIRKVQDLPILGKMVQLEICSHEYECINNDCEVTTFAETFDGFLNTYSRMTERCADFICTLAMEASCEGCARICKALGIKISGDTVIRLLLRKYGDLPRPEVDDVIGVDDFAYKKRHTYGTIIVNEENHEPIALLDGRNVDTLRSWLKNNKHIKVVTRDRASAYAKVISEEWIFLLIPTITFVLCLTVGKIGRNIHLAWLGMWFITQFLSHEWYTIFGSGFMGDMDKKIAYFSDCIKLIDVRGRYVPDLYHIVLHILIIVAFVMTLLFRNDKNTSSTKA